MRRIIFAVVLLCLAVPTLASAQGVLVVSQNKCQLDKQSDIRAFADSATIPIAQELVNEGKLWAAGTAYHAWGDEWNVVNWYTAETMSGFLEKFPTAAEPAPDDLVAWIERKLTDKVGLNLWALVSESTDAGVDDSERWRVRLDPASS